MIIEIATFFFIISITSIIIGYIMDFPFLCLIGYTFFFLISMAIITPGIDLNIGQNVTIVNSSVTLITPIRTTYTNIILGIVLAFASIGGFVITLMNLRGRKTP